MNIFEDFTKNHLEKTPKHPFYQFKRVVVPPLLALLQSAWEGSGSSLHGNLCCSCGAWRELPFELGEDFLCRGSPGGLGGVGGGEWVPGD